MDNDFNIQFYAFQIYVHIYIMLRNIRAPEIIPYYMAMFSGICERKIPLHSKRLIHLDGCNMCKEILNFEKNDLRCWGIEIENEIFGNYKFSNIILADRSFRAFIYKREVCVRNLSNKRTESQQYERFLGKTLELFFCVGHSCLDNEQVANSTKTKIMIFR